eukprot:TRINITY_DN16682_c0_g2_i1.p1 TRINITY_DN16682_c0_g2~~TRINITY_DN16682_c0_g2_i1.p1  ORF type:complete len:208 (-),score=44.21 TRINITY_DN16682_c0_g2_i1:17-640(-)
MCRSLREEQASDQWDQWEDSGQRVVTWQGSSLDGASAMLSLPGKWKDARGSIYECTPSSPGRSLDVRTVRPDGQVVQSKRLIRFDASGAVVWGARPSFVLEELHEDEKDSSCTLLWVSADHKDKRLKPFRWEKLSSLAAEKSTADAESWPTWEEVTAEEEDAWPTWKEVLEEELERPRTQHELDVKFLNESEDFKELCELLKDMDVA